MAYETLVLEHDGAIARVWLDRPDRHNALNPQALEEIADVFHSSGPTPPRLSWATSPRWDGDLLATASSEDPTRFALPAKRG